ncbi:TonB-dependent hemoglobin/transferrin/lactoferrin family receptor [Luteimonas kalidii]|uniref:TonB-dependent hemoglobin/transferrin/lactoferrin family receptor n=1 Tax=Luteimonas kalidii TaxID=3042025 RepID=A0ABT6JW11_9GAMM|nr:TonB-dependent hemoglobin/transferrin/lactoferrin family receptor [Luteimonas kalidii]MDH5834642.1 TonB-dependent hemoglobin/transferrin/lactoferrin family receptor [Luteimonas kalidii]
MRPTLLAAALALALPRLALANPDTAAAAAPEPADLDRVVVTATRTERAITDVPNTVDRIDRARMDALLVRDLKDLFRYEPGITVTEGFGRFGIGDIRVRGLGGNRVRIQTDGIAVPDAFSIGSFSNANRNFVDLDTLKAVEVVRGPTSSLYGSDALGGTVSFITRDPGDLLADGADTHLGFKLGIEGDWNGLSGGATAASAGERWSGLVAVHHRQGQETENMGEVGGTGSARTRPNPQQRDGRSVLAKLLYAPDARQRVRLTVEGNEDDADTDLLTARGVQALTGADNTRVAARDHQSRTRVALTHEVDDAGGGFADAFDWQAYVQDSRTTQYTIEERTLPAPTLRDIRERSFEFEQRVVGLQANMRKALDAGRARHELAWGVDLSRTDTAQRRDGLRSFPLTGSSTPSMPPDDFPVRDFPLSETTSAAMYVQDEIAFADGRFRLVPGLRVDHYRLQPELDPIFAGDNPGVAVVDLTETSVSPKLGMVRHLGDAWSLFGGYARGFRAPPYADVNIGFTNVMFGYTAIANPGLRPETSDGLELGVRFSTDIAYASLAAYHNRYEDFIESFSFVGTNPGDLMVFQSVNVARARIQGVEFKGGVDLGALSQDWDGWSLRAAAAWSRGDDRSAGVPLESVDPLTASFGIAFDAHDWGMELAGRFAGRRDRLPPAPEASAEYFESPGHGVLDLFAHWNFASGASFNAGVFNLTDRMYWPAGGIALVGADSATLDRYTAPGRHVGASLSVSW